MSREPIHSQVDNEIVIYVVFLCKRMIDLHAKINDASTKKNCLTIFKFVNQLILVYDW